MKVMILPSVCVPECGSAILLARQLAAMFRLAGYDTAVCADRNSKFSDIAFYESPSPSSLRRSSPGTTIEEYLRSRNGLSVRYLKKDFSRIEYAIEEWEPDLLVEIERPAAIAAAVIHGLAVFSIVSSSSFRNRDFRADTLNGLNSFLDSLGMEQVLHLRELYRFSQCFAFGPAEFLSRFRGYNVACFGMSSIKPVEKPADRTLSIMITESGIPARKLKPMIESAFRGAPYDVYIYSSSFHPGKIDNLHFLNVSRTIALNGSKTCIHDGSDALTQYCTALGIPQIILHDDSCQRAWNAACVKRSGAGLVIHEDDLTMEKLYETFRRIMADDRFFLQAERLQAEVFGRGDLSSILAYI